MSYEERHEVQVTRDVNTPPTQPVQYERRVAEVEDASAGRRVFVARLARLIWLLAGILIVLIGIRAGLKLIDANPASGFAAFVYGVTAPFLAPFMGLTASPATGTGGYLEIPAVIAMFVYALVAWVIVELVTIVLAPGRRKMVQRSVDVRRQE